MAIFVKKYKNMPKMAKASLWFLICSFLQKGISFISTPIFTRLMTTEEYGKYSVFATWEGIISIFITLNLSYGVYSQGLVKYEEDRKKYSSSMQGLTITLITIWTIIYLIFHNFFNYLFGLNTIYMLLMIFIIWITAIFNFWSAEQRVDYNYKLLLIFTIFASIFNPLFSIILMKFMKDKVLARIMGITISYLLFYFWMLFAQLIKGKRIYEKIYWKHALKFNIPLIPHYLSQTILNSSDRIMINKYVNSSSAGIYSLAYSVSLIMTLVNNAIGQTLSPWIYKKIKYNLVDEISNVVLSSLLIVAIMNLILIAFAPEVIAIFAPKEYYEAIWIIPPVAMSVYFMFMYDIFAKFEFYFEKTKLISLATIVGAIINIVTNYIFINKYGYVAAGYTTLICYMIYAFFHYCAMKKICNEKYEGKNPYNTKIILIITVLFLMIGFAFLALYNHLILRYILISILAIICISLIKKIKGEKKYE